MDKITDYYQQILNIDNDVYKYDENSVNIEEIRNKLITDIINLLEDNMSLCETKDGKAFLDTIIYPSIKN